MECLIELHVQSHIIVTQSFKDAEWAEIAEAGWCNV